MDLIDATQAFVAGVPLWGSLVAVHEDDRVVASAIATNAGLAEEVRARLKG